MSEYFRKTKSLGGNVIVQLDFSKCATESNLENAASVDTSKFAIHRKLDLASWKSDVDELDIGKLKNVLSGLSSLKNKVDKLDIYKLETIPVDLSKLSDVVKMKLLKSLNLKN